MCELAFSQKPATTAAPKVVRVRFEAAQLAVLEAEARRRVEEGLAQTVDLSEIVRDMVVYWMRTEGR